MTDLGERPSQPESTPTSPTGETQATPNDALSSPSASGADRRRGFTTKALAAGTAVLALTAGAVGFALKGGGESSSVQNTEQTSEDLNNTSLPTPETSGMSPETVQEFEAVPMFADTVGELIDAYSKNTELGYITGDPIFRTTVRNLEASDPELELALELEFIYSNSEYFDTSATSFQAELVEGQPALDQPINDISSLTLTLNEKFDVYSYRTLDQTDERIVTLTFDRNGDDSWKLSARENVEEISSIQRR